MKSSEQFRRVSFMRKNICTAEEIKKMIENGEKITDELKFIFEKHF